MYNCTYMHIYTKQICLKTCISHFSLLLYLELSMCTFYDTKVLLFLFKNCHLPTRLIPPLLHKAKKCGDAVMGGGGDGVIPSIFAETRAAESRGNSLMIHHM